MTGAVRRASQVGSVRRETTSVDTSRTAQVIEQQPLSLGGEVTIWQGKVVNFNLVAQTADITLGGLPTVVEGVAHNSNYRPKVGDVIWVFQLGDTDFLILDRVGAFGPSIGSGAAQAVVTGTGSRSSTSYGDLGTAGPAVTVPVSPSGLLLIQVSAWIEAISDTSASEATSGAMGVSLSGANSWAPDDVEAVIVWHHIVSGLSVASNVTVGASKATLLTGLAPGLTTVTTKYRSPSGVAAEYWNRHLWALPL